MTLNKLGIPEITTMWIDNRQASYDRNPKDNNVYNGSKENKKVQMKVRHLSLCIGGDWAGDLAKILLS